MNKSMIRMIIIHGPLAGEPFFVWFNTSRMHLPINIILLSDSIDQASVDDTHARSTQLAPMAGPDSRGAAPIASRYRWRASFCRFVRQPRRPKH